MKALVYHGPGERGWDTVDDRRSFGVGVLDGMVSPGDVGAIVGAGPIGLAAILTARLYTPAQIVAIDLADSRLQGAQRVGADVRVDNSREDAVARVMQLTDGLGADVTFEAVGVPETFACRRPSSWRPSWSASADVWPTSGCTATRDVAPGEAVDPQRHDHHWPGRYVQHPAAHSGREPPGPSSSRARLARGARRRDPGRRPLRASMRAAASGCWWSSLPGRGRR